MASRETEALWRSRLRWRLRGASLWPTFGVCLILDTVLLMILPIAGDNGPGFVPALLLSAFFNLVVAAAGARLGGTVLRRRRRDIPKVVADDRAGTALLFGLSAVLLLVGLAHRPAMREAQNDFAVQSRAARSYVRLHAPVEYRVNAGEADAWKQGPGLYRTCVPGPDPRKNLCLIVKTHDGSATVAPDSDQRPNETVRGPG
jgi:hypothetical protein